MSNYGYKQQVSMANVGPNMGYGAAYGYGAGYGGGYAQPYAQPYTQPYAQQATVSNYTAASTMPPQVPSGSVVTPGGGNIVSVSGNEESYVENILRLNRGKIGTFYMTYENNREWNAKIFKGRIEAAGRDHIIISDPNTGMRFLLLMLNLDYVTFDEPIKYEYPFNGGTITESSPVNE
ncbi:spore coat protein GerQ [Paenibacillus sp. 1011MAR3C5]|uniref:spore coat protein GerQ n=1 Tax=Paenibacillus sp. 1011MAR3C5 TaxID=1675787 RepID=UPI000E6D2564|nr:spore coat protein GerQ [Paenibacillus sp. 1011MAR3C5]RJE88905.1 spore coat protein GerQ [Paenibacillus sp. 1011MAR3C5]